MRRGTFLFLVLLALTFDAFGIQAAGPKWKLIDLGNLGNGGYNFAIASAIGNDGTVAGYSIAPEPNPQPGQPTGLSHGFLWRNGSMVDIGMPNHLGVTIVDMNASGTLIGSTDGTSISGGVVWRDGTWTDLAPLAFPRAINNSGVIVGQHGYMGADSEAFVYTGSALLGLGTFGGKESYALGVNDRGQVVGGSQDAQGRMHAFLWQDGITTDLGMFDGDHTGGVDINNNGVALVATQSHSTGRWTAYLWDGAVSRKLFEQPFGMDFYSRAMNDRGDVIAQVGRNNVLYGGVFSDGELTLLDEIPEVIAAGLHDMNPARINNRGWIVGAAKDINGNYHAFLLIKRMLK